MLKNSKKKTYFIVLISATVAIALSKTALIWGWDALKVFSRKK